MCLFKYWWWYSSHIRSVYLNVVVNGTRLFLPPTLHCILMNVMEQNDHIFIALFHQAGDAGGAKAS